MEYPNLLSFAICTKSVVYCLIIVALVAFVGFWGFLFSRDPKPKKLNLH